MGQGMGRKWAGEKGGSGAGRSERGASAPPDVARQGHIDRAGLKPRIPIPRFMAPMHAQK